MPYDIKKMDGKYCVVKTPDGEKVACHDTRGSAVDQMRALYASEADKSSYAISAEFNLGEVSDAIHHLRLALETDLSPEARTHVKEALDSLTSEPDEDVVEAPVPAYASGDNFEFADDMEEFAWSGPIVFENVTTGDNRVFRTDSIQWEAETLPWAFRWQKASGQGHAGSVPVGRVDRIERQEDGSIFGYGVVIPGLSEEAAEYLRMLQSGVGGGVSVDGDSAQFDVQEAAVKDGPPRIEFSSMRLRALSAVDIPAFNGARIKLVEAPEAVLADGEETEFVSIEDVQDAVGCLESGSAFADEEKDEEDKEDSLPALKKELAEKIKAAGGPFKSTPEIKALRKKIADLTPEDEKKKGGFPFDAETEALCFDPKEELAKKRKKRNKKAMGAYSWKFDEALVAAAIPTLPSTDAFIEPNFDGPTALTVTQDGKVFGHLALFNTCHIGFPGTCVKPPKGSDYRYFHTGEIETAEGDLVETGRLTFGTGHAQMNGTARGAAEHYDNTGTVAADVRAGEDQFGIWVVGALRPHLTDEMIREFRAAPLSGDWRKIAGRLELVGALAVNVPGFPVPRVRALVASGETEALFTFLEGDDEMFTSDEERLNKKVELASKVAALVKKAEALPEKMPVDSNGDPDLVPEPPKQPSKAEIKKAGENLTEAQLKENLKLIRELLDDEDEKIAEGKRKQLEAVYQYFIKNGLKGEARTEANTMELVYFCNGYDITELTTSGFDVVEFYNKCHSAESGRFCEGTDGPGRVRDKKKLKGRFAVPSNTSPGLGPNPSRNPGGGGGGQGQGNQGQGQGNQGQQQQQGFGGPRALSDAQKNVRFGAQNAGEKYEKHRNGLLSAARWTAAASTLWAAASVPAAAAAIATISPILTPSALLILAGISAATATSKFFQAQGFRQDANAEVRKTRNARKIIRDFETAEKLAASRS